MEEDVVDDVANKPKKKGTTIKTRKSAVRRVKGDYGDSDDDDFESKVKVKKAAGSKKNDEDKAKARTAASKAKIAATAAIFGASDEEEDEEPARKRLFLNDQDSNHSGSEMKAPSKPSKPIKPAAGSRTVSSSTTGKRKRSATALSSPLLVLIPFY
jgi:hypothetical protein